jgi:hypothetical protein
MVSIKCAVNEGKASYEAKLMYGMLLKNNNEFSNGVLK